MSEVYKILDKAKEDCPNRLKWFMEQVDGGKGKESILHVLNTIKNCKAKLETAELYNRKVIDYSHYKEYKSELGKFFSKHEILSLDFIVNQHNMIKQALLAVKKGDVKSPDDIIKFIHESMNLDKDPHAFDTELILSADFINRLAPSLGFVATVFKNMNRKHNFLYRLISKKHEEIIVERFNANYLYLMLFESQILFLKGICWKLKREKPWKAVDVMSSLKEYQFLLSNMDRDLRNDVGHILNTKSKNYSTKKVITLCEKLFLQNIAFINVIYEGYIRQLQESYEKFDEVKSNIGGGEKMKVSKEAEKFFETINKTAKKDKKNIDFKLASIYWVELFDYLKTVGYKHESCYSYLDKIFEQYDQDYRFMEENPDKWFDQRLLSHEFLSWIDYVLFQLKSCLDVMGHVINLVYNIGIDLKSVNIDQAIDRFPDKEDSFYKSLVEHREKWIKTFNMYRKYITHHKLLTTSINLEMKAGDPVKICPHMLPDNPDAKTRTTKEKRDLKQFFNDCHDNTFLLMDSLFKALNEQLIFAELDN